MKIAFFALFLLAGIVLLAGAWIKWGLLFRSRKANALVEGTHFVQGQIFYGVFGIVLIIISLIIVLVPQVGQTLTGKPDAMAILKVEADGCTVTRSEVVGADADESLMWNVIDQDYHSVFSRSAEDEVAFKYTRPGVFDVILQSWHNGAYVTISNKVEVNCSN
jgi:hypothetical protein